MSETARSDALFRRAKEVIPGGVSSPVRAFMSVGGTPRYVREARGSRIIDADGREYVDLVGSWGPMILGHAHPEVVAAVTASLGHSASFGAPCEPEVELAEEIVARVGAAERVRFTSSGTEAVMTAVRIARAATRRSTIVKFAGCYHGHADAMLVSAGSGAATLGLPDSPGVTPGAAGDTIVLPYGDIGAIDAVFAEHGDTIAAVITEAAPANMGVIPPPPGFNRHLASTARQHGSLLVLDEVMTGFRVTRSGWWGLEGSTEGWAPDLFTFGKVIGGGLPLAAVAGSAQYMDLLAPMGAVYQAGTLSGNPAATTAGLATVQRCDGAVYSHLDAMSAEVRQVIGNALHRAGVPHAMQHAGNLFSCFLGVEGPVTDLETARAQSTAAYASFFHSMLEFGVWLPPSAFEAWFVSAAHGDDDLAIIEAAAAPSAEAAARALTTFTGGA